MRAGALLLLLFALGMSPAQPMQGVYTIKKDGSGDFTSFVEAGSALVARGVSGHVAFEAYTGTYDDGMVDMRYANTGGKTVTFRPALGQTVAVGGAGGSLIFWASGDLGPTHNIKVENLKLVNTTSWAACAARCNGWRVSNCQIQTGGGVWFGGSSDSVYNCTIQFPGRTGDVGIGMYFAGSNNYGANNLVSNATMIGVYALSSAPRLYFNTVITDSLSGNSIGFYNNGSSGSILKCNIFVGTYRAYYSSTGMYPSNSNYNDWYSQGAGADEPFELAGRGALSLEQWREFTKLDTNSLSCDPEVTDKRADLHLLPTSPCIGFGAPYGAVTTDIDGEARDPQHPDIGGDEYYPTGTRETSSLRLQTPSLRIEPNPARTAASLRLTANGPTELRLFDAQGRQVLVRPVPYSASPVPHSLSLDLSGLPSGVYLVRLDGRSCSVTQRLIVQR